MTHFVRLADCLSFPGFTAVSRCTLTDHDAVIVPMRMVDRPQKDGARRVVNRRLCKAYLLKESFGQLWDNRRPGLARRFFDRWRQSLRWQRLPSFEKFARLVERHWDGIDANCHAKNKVAFGFIESMNHPIYQLQHQPCGYRDEDYFRLKFLTHKLPKL